MRYATRTITTRAAKAHPTAMGTISDVMTLSAAQSIAIVEKELLTAIRYT